LGRKSLNELKLILKDHGLHLGMTLGEIEKIDGEYK
jgi:DNA-directed RNA polymerase alpha subunit